MLDVHPPHESIHGWRDFLLHLGTITIGLLIALSLEGCVEWTHHRHLVHDAEAGLKTEIRANAKALKGAAADLQKRKGELKEDARLLQEFINGHKVPKDAHMEINFQIARFDDLSWKTAQSTGAISYMAYDEAKEYAGIYGIQAQMDSVQQQTARDAIVSLAPFINLTGNFEPKPAEASAIKEHIEILQGQLLLIEALVVALDKEYKSFLAAHPD